MCCICPRVFTNLPLYSIYDLSVTFTNKGNSAMRYFSHVETVQKGVSTFISFPVGNLLFKISTTWSVWAILKLKGDQQIKKSNYLRKYSCWILIPKASSNNFLISVNNILLLLVFRTLLSETVIYVTVPSYNTLM